MMRQSPKPCYPRCKVKLRPTSSPVLPVCTRLARRSTHQTIDLPEIT